MSEAILQVTNLVKKIKGKTILDHISFEVGQGDCLALIGPNGAGKTTLMSCILGDKKASSGQIFIKGKKGKAQDQIAVLLQENTIPSQLRVKELIAFFQDISENDGRSRRNTRRPCAPRTRWPAPRRRRP